MDYLDIARAVIASHRGQTAKEPRRCAPPADFKSSTDSRSNLGVSQDNIGFWQEFDMLEVDLLDAIYRGEKPEEIEAARQKIRDHFQTRY